MKHSWFAWVPAAVWAAVLFLVSSRPSLGVDLGGGLDKVAHFSAYFVFGLLLAYGASRQALPALIAVAIGVLYGATDELHQSLVPGRSAEVADWVADALGTMTGVALYILARRKKGRHRNDFTAARCAESRSI